MDIVRVPVETATRAPGGRTNAYVVATARGDVLVDPAARTDELGAAVANWNVAHVAVTHTHPDHVDGVAHYADACDATVWARHGRERQFERRTGVAPDRTFVDGTTIGDGVTVLDAPGHAPDHVAFAAGDAMLVGDLLLASGSVVVDDADGDMRAYVTSLRRLYARGPATLYPGHGSEIDTPRPVIERLLAHRLDREARVRDAVHAGARTVGEVLDHAYDKDLSGVRDLAQATVRAHLDKLAVEGAVVRDGDQVHPA